MYTIAISPSSFAAEDKTPLDLLHEAGVKVLPNPYGRRLTEDEIISHLHGVDGLIAGLEPLNHRVLHSSPQLKALARVGIGMDNVDLKAATELGIKVSNTPDGPTQSVAEMTLAAMLFLCRGILQANTDLHNNVWKKSIGTGIQGTKVLLVGYGRIGRAVGRVVASLGAEVLVADPLITQEELVNGERVMELCEALQVADVISLHASGREVLLGTDEFSRMKDGVIILNGARGELVDEDALIANLDNGRVHGAWMDVFLEEPYQGRLMSYDQVLLTPHIATYTRQCRRSMEEAAVRNLLSDLDIKPKDVIDKV